MMHKTQQSKVFDVPVLAELVALVALAETLSFQQAAERLHRDATVVSRRVGALEKRLGVRLVDRNTRSVAFTEAGLRYVERARNVLQSLDEANREASQFVEGEPRGHLRLSLPEGFGRLWIAPAITEFLRAYPLITIEAEYSNRYVDLIGERFDLAVRLGELTDSRLVARHIGNRSRALYASPDYLAAHGMPEKPADLEQHSCLVWLRNSTRNRWELEDVKGGKVRVSVSGVLLSNDAEALIHSAKAGLGIVLSADWLAGPSIKSGELVRVLPEWRSANEGGIYIVTPARSGSTNKTKAFANWIAGRLSLTAWDV